MSDYEAVFSNLAYAAIACILLPIVILIYLFLRDGIFIRVNCWFCNLPSKASFSQRNSYYCPHCSQYNGFDKNGDYNKVIEEQHINTSRINGIARTSPKSKSTNGLCKFCNHNQHIKVIQLAQFEPMNDKNYDTEIEHFRKQLDNAYKLCNKCDKVLKTTILKQNLILFGAGLRNLPKSGMALLNLSSSASISKESKFLIKIARAILIVFNLSVIGNILLKTQIELPDIFEPFTFVFANLYSTFGLNELVAQTFKYQEVNYVPLTSFGCLLHLYIFFYDTQRPFVKANRILSWIILIVTTGLNFGPKYQLFITILQLATSILQIFCLTTNNLPRKKPSKSGFQKLGKKLNDTNAKICDIAEDELEDTLSDSSTISHKSVTTANKSQQDNLQSAQSHNKIFNSSFKDDSLNINKCLNNLQLGPPTFRPIVLPPKFTQNSWTAGGYWKSADGVILPAAQPFNNCFSRTSSQSSGFGSQAQFNSLPTSRNHSACGDFDRFSLLSEPTYNFNSSLHKTPPPAPTFSHQTESNALYYRSNDNTFHPVLNQNRMLCLYNNHDRQNNFMYNPFYNTSRFSNSNGMEQTFVMNSNLDSN